GLTYDILGVIRPAWKKGWISVGITGIDGRRIELYCQSVVRCHEVSVGATKLGCVDKFRVGIENIISGESQRISLIDSNAIQHKKGIGNSRRGIPIMIKNRTIEESSVVIKEAINNSGST